MKKQRRYLLILLLGTTLLSNAFSQAITENFNDPNNLGASGWVRTNLSAPIGTTNWFTGNPTVFPAFSAPDTSYIGANFNNVAGANTISNWLMSPVRTFSNGDVISFYTRTIDSPTYPDRLQLRLSLNGASTNAGGTSASVGDFTILLLDINPTLTTAGYPNTWTQYSATISGLAAPTSGRVAFRYFVTNGGPTGTNSDYIGIDNFQYTPFVALNPDLIAGPLVGEYTIIPLEQAYAMPLINNITNSGTAVATDAQLTTNVFLAPDFVTPIQTNTSTAVSINNGASSLINVGATFTPTTTGDYLIQYITNCTGNTITSADTLDYFFTVSDSTFARDNGTATGNLGIGAGNGGHLGNMFALNTASSITSVTMFLGNSPTGVAADTVYVDVFAFNNGLPTTLLGSSLPIIRVGADTVPGIFQVSFSPALSVPADTIVVCARELPQGTIQVGLADNIFNLGTTWVNWPTSPFAGWANNEDFAVPAFNKTYIIRPNFGPIPCPTMNISFAVNHESCVGCNNGSVTATPAGGVLPYTYAWSPSGGTAATASSLAPGMYILTVTDSAGCTGVDTVTINAATPCPTITISFTSNNESCAGCNDGSATGTPTGGTAPYTYAWSPAGGTAATASSLAPGMYILTVTDSVGCMATDTITINSFNSIEMFGIGNVKLYPNPSDGKFFADFELDHSGELMIKLITTDGKVISTEVFMYESATTKEYNFNYLPKGTYLFEVTYRGNKSARQILIK